jgi:hypothetical protein
MTEHTATPWIFKLSTSKRLAFVETENREYPNFSRIVEMSKRHNPNFEGDAAFIVRACNAHDDLLAACKALLYACELADADGELDYRIDGELLDAARAAIAAAEEAG